MGSLMQLNADYVNLWKVCRIIFVLSHSQAVVERGFNINDELLVESMKDKSLISQRMVYDYFSASNSDLHNYQVDKQLLLSCKGARMRYDSYLENEKQKSSRNRKIKEKLVTNGIALVKKEKKDWLDCIASLDTDITRYRFDREKKEDFKLLKRMLFEKAKSVAALGVALGNLENDLIALE